MRSESPGFPKGGKRISVVLRIVEHKSCSNAPHSPTLMFSLPLMQTVSVGPNCYFSLSSMLENPVPTHDLESPSLMRKRLQLR
jgi:hypothetical protein